jgi:ubiquinone/menaquinone biosynthesis C-methylase UbiE
VRLNSVEFALMNNPVRAFVQRRVEAPQLLRKGGPVSGGLVLEIGCGRGIGVDILLESCGARQVHGFDLDPRMITQAQGHLRNRKECVDLWIGDGACIPVADRTYDAVFDFGIIHHVPDWRQVLSEVARVLKPGGRFYGEEVTRRLITNPVIRQILSHPQHDRFDREQFNAELRKNGMNPVASGGVLDLAFWFVAVRDDAA